MATTSTVLSLRKPAGPDTVSVVTDLSNNFQLIDDFCASAVAVNQAIGDTAAAGTTLQAARADHKHGMPAFATPASVGAANANGAATTVPRSDHVHGLGSAAFGSPVGVGAANADGVATTAARADHVHVHATASLGSVSNLTGASADGTATTASRSDHKHSLAIASQAAGDIIYATSATAFTRLAIGAATTVLHGGSSAPSYGTVDTADITALAVTQIQSVAVSGTTTSASLVDATGTITMTSTGGPIVAFLMSSSFSTVAADTGSVAVQIDAVDKTVVGTGVLSNAVGIPASAIGLATPASGSRVIKARFRRDSGTGTVNFGGTLIAVELKR